MRGPRTPTERKALDAYAGAARGDRFHVAMRWRTCPFPAVAASVPGDGRVLEVGCGHGLLALYLALAAPGRAVTGVDIDGDKLVIAKAAAAHAGADVTYSQVAPDGFIEGAFDAIVIADVLYLLPAEARRTLLDRCVEHLAPGGRLIVKEADNRPRWKAAITVAQELLATKVLRITEGEGVAFESPSALADHLRGRGLTVDLRRIDRGYLHPHVLIVGSQP